MTKTVEKQECRSCGQPIYWLRHSKTDKLAPIDAEFADPKVANISVNLRQGVYFIVKPGTGMFTSHFATCRGSVAWRKKQQGL